MTDLLQSERSWSADNAEVGKKSSGPKIPRRGGSSKIARAEGPWAIFGEPERPKPRSWADRSKMSQLTQQNNLPRMTNSLRIKNSAENDKLSVMLKNDIIFAFDIYSDFC